MDTDPRSHDHLTLEPALTTADREAVFHLRYRAWQAVGGMAPNDAEQVRDALDDSPFAYSYMLRDRGRLVGTVRSNVYRHGQPGHHLFLFDFWPTLELPWLADAGPVVESSRLAVDPRCSESYATYVLRLFRAHNANAAAYGVRYVVSAAQRRHIPFYRQRLKMEAVTEPMPVPGLNVEAGSVLRLDYPAHIGQIEARFPDTVLSSADAARLVVPDAVGVATVAAGVGARP